MTRGVRAPAKVNVLLRILGREATGYHSLETVFLELDLADELIISPADEGIVIEVEDDPSVPADASNLCWRAAELFADRAGEPASVGIRLRKRIPAGAGLGGGSSDAAAVLRALNDAAGEPFDLVQLAEIGGSLGSDIPFFISGGPFALAWERGRRLLPLGTPPPRPVLVVAPPFEISAAEAYTWLAAAREASPPVSGGCVLPAPALLSDWDVLERLAFNDFEAVVYSRRPELRGVRDQLMEAGARIAMLSGSGGAVFGVFGDREARDSAASSLDLESGYRTIRTTTFG